MDSRTSILNSIKTALSDVDKSKLSAPQMPKIWDVKGLSKEEMSQAFAQNLKSVAGEAFLCASEEEAVSEISKVLKEVASKAQNATRELAVYGSEQARTVAAKFANVNSDWTILEAPQNPAADPKKYQTMTASLVSPIVLLADTGSCAIEARSAFERFLCYLSPVCLVIAKASQLREHLPNAWKEIESIMRRSDQHGEVAIVTGPSRTADIEKKLVLGVHGPQRLIVFIVND